MSVYSSIVFVHVLGAFGIVASGVLEWAGLSRLRAAASIAALREQVTAWEQIRWLGAPSLAATLITAIYLASTWGWAQAWTGLAAGAFLLLPALGGGISGVRLTRLKAAIPEGDGPLPPALGAAARDPLLLLSVRLRMGALVGIIFLMEVKPPAPIAAAALAAGLLAGLALAAPAWRQRGALA